MQRIRKASLIAACFTIGLLGVNTYSYASNGDPHHEQRDGCDHGNSNKDCRDDPSDHGKDCQDHGNHGGKNEDHCSTTTTTAHETTTTTSVVPTTVTTEAPAVTTTTEVPTTVTTEVPTTVTTEAPVTTTTTQAPAVAPATTEPLPFTGSHAETLAEFGALALVLGLGTRKVAKHIS